ncbi:hypothetical protein [Celerinatantimonas sp. YJH-8]|uniref:hypothetical protein n=1 Tax=Celerinatantimonas sp. YJH-8 TaxID=3228714 RepID=UPI0038C3E157
MSGFQFIISTIYIVLVPILIFLIKNSIINKIKSEFQQSGFNKANNKNFPIIREQQEQLARSIESIKNNLSKPNIDYRIKKELYTQKVIETLTKVNELVARIGERSKLEIRTPDQKIENVSDNEWADDVYEFFTVMKQSRPWIPVSIYDFVFNHLKDVFWEIRDFKFEHDEIMSTQDYYFNNPSDKKKEFLQKERERYRTVLHNINTKTFEKIDYVYEHLSEQIQDYFNKL